MKDQKKLQRLFGKLCTGSLISGTDKIRLAFYFLDWEDLETKHRTHQLTPDLHDLAETIQFEVEDDVAGNPGLLPIGLFTARAAVNLRELAENQDMFERLSQFIDVASGYILYHRESGNVYRTDHGKIAETLDDLDLEVCE